MSAPTARTPSAPAAPASAPAASTPSAPASTAGATAAPPIVVEVCKALGVPVARLHDIDNDVVSKSLKALGAGLGDFAAVNIFVADLRVAAASKRDPYAAHKSKKEEKSLFPY